MALDILNAVFNAFIPAGLHTYAEIALAILAGKELWDIAGKAWNKK